MNAIILEQGATTDNLLTKLTVSSVMILVCMLCKNIGLCISSILLIKVMMMTAVLLISVLVRYLATVRLSPNMSVNECGHGKNGFRFMLML